MIRMLVDSTCDLPREELALGDVGVIPLQVVLGDAAYRDGETISVQDVYAAMREGILPKTAQPVPEDLITHFEDPCRQGQDVLYLSFSSALSGTCNLARTLMQEVQQRYPRRRMAVVDSRSGSTAIGLMVRRARDLIRRGATFDQTVAALEAMSRSVEHLFTIDDLRWLVAGGRLGRAQGAVGNLLSVKPLLQVRDGSIELIGKTRGRTKALRALVDLFEERSRGVADPVVGISHADDPEAARTLMNLIDERTGPKEYVASPIGSVLATHLGLGGVGVFFFNEDPDSTEMQPV